MRAGSVTMPPRTDEYAAKFSDAHLAGRALRQRDIASAALIIGRRAGSSLRMWMTYDDDGDEDGDRRRFRFRYGPRRACEGVLYF